MTESGESRLVSGLRWGGALLIVLGALTRASVGFEAFPYWAQDPTIVSGPLTALGPTGSLVIDLVILLGAGFGMLGETLAGRGEVLWLWLLAACGGARVLFYVRPGDLDLDNARLGVTWLAAVVGGLALAHLGRHQTVRRVALAAIVGFIAMLAAKGALQVFVEHPATVAEYEANKQAFLAANGWSEESVMARTFERRLEQAEASGWFGLANVYGSIAAASTVVLAGLAGLGWWASRRPRQAVPDGIVGVVTIGLFVAAACVVMAGSKAGYAVAALGVGLVGVAALATSRGIRLRPSFGGGLAFLVLVGVVIAVACRGLLGESLGERSILFRWFYMQGAARAFVEHPLLGTGPGGFKDAYMLLKPALSPENVESPHSILLDFAARLGILGLSWGALFLALVWSCGRVLLRSAHEQAVGWTPTPRASVWVFIALASIPTLISGWIEAAAATPESAAARAAGLVAWIVLSVCALGVMRASAWWERAAAAGAIALAAHAQIEMTGVFPGSAALFFAVLGLAAAPAVPIVVGRRKGGLMVASVILLTAAAIAVLVLAKTWRWEFRLREAAVLVEPVAEFRARLSALVRGDQRGDSVEQLAHDLGTAAGVPPPTRQDQFDQTLEAFASRRMGEATEALQRAERITPHHQPTAEAISRLCLSHAAMLYQGQDPGTTSRARFLSSIAAEFAGIGAKQSSTATAWGWAGTVYNACAAVWRDDGHERFGLEQAVGAWTQAAALDPHGITFPLQAMEAEVRLGNAAAAAEWARKVLEINEQLRLDPLIQLTPEQRRRVEQVAAEATGGP